MNAVPLPPLMVAEVELVKENVTLPSRTLQGVASEQVAPIASVVDELYAGRQVRKLAGILHGGSATAAAALERPSICAGAAIEIRAGRHVRQEEHFAHRASGRQRHARLQGPGGGRPREIHVLALRLQVDLRLAPRLLQTKRNQNPSEQHLAEQHLAGYLTLLISI